MMFVLLVISFACCLISTVVTCEGIVEIRKLRRQRDCLHKHFDAFAEKYFFYEPLPEDLIEVLNQIEGRRNCLTARDLRPKEIRNGK